jgi:Skp family chaperone for outer membrane proteins
MLLRLSLIIAILAGLAALYFTHVQVSDRITNLTTELDTAKTNADKARQDESKAKTEAKKAKEDFDKAAKDLSDKTAALNDATGRLTEQEARASKASEEATTLRGQLNETQQKLNAFIATEVPVEQIRGLRDRIEKVGVERDTYIAENKVLLRNINQLQSELSRYVGTKEVDIKLPAGLKGKVVAVDPKYNFVVLDIGGNQGVLENGKLLVNRDGKLIAKVRIAKVEPNRSIANVMPEWEQAEVLEGDQVLY